VRAGSGGRGAGGAGPAGGAGVRGADQARAGAPPLEDAVLVGRAGPRDTAEP
jgi:hypothetical protein